MILASFDVGGVGGGVGGIRRLNYTNRKRLKYSPIASDVAAKTKQAIIPVSCVTSWDPTPVASITNFDVNDI